MHDRMMQTLAETPAGEIARLNNFEYRSYTVAADRESLAKDQEAEYQSDIEILYIPDLDTIVRVCYCKHRRLL
jgi:hypothetical protein